MRQLGSDGGELNDTASGLNVQVPLLTVIKEVAPLRVPGRLPVYQVWFDLQPLALEGTGMSAEGTET